MEHAHTPAADDHILAAFLEPGALPDIAKRVNMSLAALATWAGRHAALLTNMHTLITTRCKLIAAHLELSALTALAAVSSAVTTSDEPKLRERALERQRKAACAILRHRTCLERNLRARGASAGPQAPPHAHQIECDGLPPSPRVQRGEVPERHRREGDEGPSLALEPAKLSISQRLAARRLASLAAT